MNEILQLWDEISKMSPEEFVEWFDKLTPGEQEEFYRQIDLMQEAITELWNSYKTLSTQLLESFEAFTKVLNETMHPIIKNLIEVFNSFDCGHECHWVEPYGWVPEADCPIHDHYPVDETKQDGQD